MHAGNLLCLMQNVEEASVAEGMWDGHTVVIIWHLEKVLVPPPPLDTCIACPLALPSWPFLVCELSHQLPWLPVLSLLLPYLPYLLFHFLCVPFIIFPTVLTSLPPTFYPHRAQYRTMRASIIDMVLATDMSKHFEHLQKFKAAIDASVSATHWTMREREWFDTALGS